jgi:hypothetical protein
VKLFHPVSEIAIKQRFCFFVKSEINLNFFGSLNLSFHFVFLQSFFFCFPFLLQVLEPGVIGFSFMPSPTSITSSIISLHS